MASLFYLWLLDYLNGVKNSIVKGTQESDCRLMPMIMQQYRSQRGASLIIRCQTFAVHRCKIKCELAAKRVYEVNFCHYTMPPRDVFLAAPLFWSKNALVAGGAGISELRCGR